MNNKNKTSRRESISDQSEDSRQTTAKIDRFRVRVLQKHLVYIIGLPANIASAEVLQKKKYLGQYGHIDKISVNRNSFTGKGQKGPSFSVYVSFRSEVEASLAILALNNLVYGGQHIKASFGTTKYCTYFLKKIQCPNLPDCFFLHCLEKDKEIDERDSKPTKEMFQNQQRLALQVIQANLKDIEENLSDDQDEQTIFPSLKEIIEQFKKEPAEQNPQIEQPQQQRCGSQPQQLTATSVADLNTFEQLPLRKAQSQIYIPPEIGSDRGLQIYIREQILKSCLKSYEASSRLWFAKNQTGYNKQQFGRVKKYVVEHLKRQC